MEEKMAFGKFIIKKRKELNMTQKELAKRLYVSESAVSKWERGCSYPDITLVSGICNVLNISEHELVTASEDLRQQEIEKESRKYQKLVKGYLWTVNGMYLIAIVTCFICNLAVSHNLTWFFIVLTALVMSFTLTSLPIILKEKRGLITVCSFYASLNLLLVTCCIYTGGNWFWIAFISIWMGFVVLFLPFIIRELPLPGGLYSHKALLCMLTDMIVLLGLVMVGSAYSHYWDRVFTVAIPVTLISASLAWIYLIVIRYLKINALFKTAVCVAATGIYQGLFNSVLSVIIDGTAFEFPTYNLNNWSYRYLNGNISVTLALGCMGIAIAFVIGGIVLTVKNRAGNGKSK